MKLIYFFILLLLMAGSQFCSGENFNESWNRNKIGSNWFNAYGGKWEIFDKKQLWCDNVGSPSWARLVSYKKTADNYRLDAKLRFSGKQGKVFRQRAGIASSIKDNIDDTSLIIWIDFNTRKICAFVKKNVRLFYGKNPFPFLKILICLTGTLFQ